MIEAQAAPCQLGFVVGRPRWLHGSAHDRQGRRASSHRRWVVSLGGLSRLRPPMQSCNTARFPGQSKRGPTGARTRSVGAETGWSWGPVGCQGNNRTGPSTSGPTHAETGSRGGLREVEPGQGRRTEHRGPCRSSARIVSRLRVPVIGVVLTSTGETAASAVDRGAGGLHHPGHLALVASRLPTYGPSRAEQCKAIPGTCEAAGGPASLRRVSAIVIAPGLESLPAEFPCG